MPKSRLIIIGAIGFVALFFILLFLGVIPGLRGGENNGSSIKLEFWGVFDDEPTINDITILIPGAEISYREFDPAIYESQLINALAAGRGPDVFMIHSSWLPKHFEKLTPVTQKQLSISSLRKLFPTVIEQNLAPDGFIYALPLYIDTLALFYNKDIFDTNGIALPPENWVQFENLIPRLRQLDSSGRIIRAAAAIGGSNKNINRATDILNTLMLQSGVPMVTPDFERADFAKDGESSLSFYTKFANPSNQFYTWSDSFLNSIDSFAEESTAMIFNYAHQIPIIKEKNPFLNFDIAPFPQPAQADKKVTYSNYWGLAVSNKFNNPTGAWSFILSFITDPNIVTEYTNKTGRLPALRELIDGKQSDPTLGVFANQALTARSWPQVDNIEIDKTFSKMINDVINGIAPLGDALDQAESNVTRLMEVKKRSF